jgi:hypothetical protein
MERNLRGLVGSGALVAPALHLASDVLEWISGGFSPLQLSLTYLGFLLMPVLLVGLYAVQRPGISRVGLLGALLYGGAFVYFAHTTLYALQEHISDYATLLARLGGLYALHGVVMIAGGLLFGLASLRARVLPPWAPAVFLAGIALNLLVGLLSVPAIMQTLGSTVRNIGLMAMGTALLRAPSRRNARAA